MTREKKIRRRAFIAGIVVGAGLAFGALKVVPKLHAYNVANKHYGHYEAEYMDSKGHLYDIDGDGDYYRWVYDCTPYCNGNHGEGEDEE